MRKRYISCEKENTECLLQLERHADQSHRQEILLHKVRARLQQSRANMSKLRDNFIYMKRCLVNCVDIVDKTIEMVEEESRVTEEFIQEIAPTNSTDKSKRSKHTVNPMIAGLPLKRATISLRRLSAEGLIHFRGGREPFSNPIVSVDVPASSILPIDDAFSLSSSDVDSDMDLSSEHSNIE